MKAIPPPEARDLERLRYWQDQMLRSRDFRDQLAVDAQLRWWHNRAMHRAFGIVFGFTTSKSGTQQIVNIDSGLAYDWFGREIILRKRQRESIPTLKEPMTLLVCYQGTASNREVKQVCPPGSCHALEEKPKFVWKPASRVEPQDGVPLLTLSTRDWRTYTRRARALSRPRIASGATIAGATQWEFWSLPFIYRSRTLIAFQVTIDTSAAGFTEVPHYFAWLQGELSNLDAKENILGVHFDHIDDVTRSSFTFRFVSLIVDLSRVRHFQQLRRQAAVNFLQKRKFYVSWLGIQPSR
jgi:hypothetical protein